jgi:hypothetical protein
MVVYSKSTIKEFVAQYGEVSFVLESGEEFEVHGSKGCEFFTSNTGQTFIRVEGMRNDEYVVFEAPIESIEHHYTHKEI